MITNNIMAIGLLLSSALAFSQNLPTTAPANFLNKEIVWASNCIPLNGDYTTYASDYYSIFNSDGADANVKKGQYLFIQRIYFYTKDGCKRFKEKVERTPNSNSNVFLARPYGLERISRAIYGEVVSFDVDEVIYERVEVAQIVDKKIDETFKDLKIAELKLELAFYYVTPGRNFDEELNSLCIFSGEENLTWRAGISRNILGRKCSVFNIEARQGATATFSFVYNPEEGLVCPLDSQNKLKSFGCTSYSPGTGQAIYYEIKK